MDQFTDRLTRYLVCQARAAEPEIDAIVAPDSVHGIYTHDNYANAAHVFLALYQTELPANPYFRSPEAARAVVRLIGGWLDKWDAAGARGEVYRFPEWCNFIMCRALERLGGELDAAIRQRMRTVVVRFVEADLPRPFFFTAPNHEIWKLVVVYLAGRLFDRPRWCEQAVFEARQLLAWQTPEGFWEEGRHHGPSMGYNHTMLSGLAVLAKEAEDETLRDAAARLAGFMGRWAFPDGTTCGAFDGRKPTAPGRACPGMELSPQGLAAMRSGLEAWDRRGWLDPESRECPAFRQAMKGDWVAAEALLYYADAAAAGATGAALPMDAEGATSENHTATFDATMARRGPWVIALSSQLSDVPKDTQFVYRLERQNRIEVWHERAAVVIGGGHSLVTAQRPLYNAWVEPGYFAEPAGYSKMDDDAGSPAMARRRSKYYPRAASSGVDGGVSWLEVVFAHATARFELQPTDGALVVRCRYTAFGIEELRLALPMLLWEDATLAVDGRRIEAGEQAADLTADREVAVDTPLFGTRAVLDVPAAGRTHVVYPVQPMRSYSRARERKLPAGFFALAFVETVLDDPGRSGAAEWRVRVE